MNTVTSNEGFFAEQKSLDRIVLPQGYHEELKTYLLEEKEGIHAVLEDLGEEGLRQNAYVGCEEDKHVLLTDIEQLDPSIQKELALYAAGLLNPLRNQLGSVGVVVSELALDYAKSLAKSLECSLLQHDYESLVEIARQKGVEPKGKDCVAFSEYQSDGYTLYDAKALIYQGLVWRLFDDSHADYGHAAILLGMEQEDSGDEALGFAFSKYSLDTDWLLTHMIFIPKNWVQAIE